MKTVRDAGNRQRPAAADGFDKERSHFSFNCRGRYVGRKEL